MDAIALAPLVRGNWNFLGIFMEMVSDRYDFARFSWVRLLFLG